MPPPRLQLHLHPSPLPTLSRVPQYHRLPYSLRRNRAARTLTSAATPPPSLSPSSSSPPVAKRRPQLRHYVYAAGGFLVFGLCAGTGVRMLLNPPPGPPPGSTADLGLLDLLSQQADELPIVQNLRRRAKNASSESSISSSASLGMAELGPLRTGSTDGNGRSADADANRERWIELDSSLIFTDSSSSPSSASSSTSISTLSTLTSIAMAGFRGLGVQRAFWNPERKQLVLIVWFGGGLSGWPGVTHGGTTATVLQDCLSRFPVEEEKASARINSSSFRIGLGDNTPSESHNPSISDGVWGPKNHHLSSLTLAYRAPVTANAFYVIRASASDEYFPPDLVMSSDSGTVLEVPSSKEPSSPGVLERRTRELSAVLERLDGKVCVRARGTVAV